MHRIHPFFELAVQAKDPFMNPQDLKTIVSSGLLSFPASVVRPVLRLPALGKLSAWVPTAFCCCPIT
jgi:hypothetical protein